MPVEVEVCGRTHVGLIREGNEDRFVMADLSLGVVARESGGDLRFEIGPKGALLAVCDGLGGAPAGEVAAELAVATVAACLETESLPPAGSAALAGRLVRAVENAHVAILSRSRRRKDERGMGATCTAAALIDGQMIVAQVGDSRLYLYAAAELRQVTVDQTVLAPVLEEGALSVGPPALERTLEQALGTQPAVRVAVSFVNLRRGDLALLCSDGLWAAIPDAVIARTLATPRNLGAACEALVSAALESGGGDNVTVILARFSGPDLPSRAQFNLRA